MHDIRSRAATNDALWLETCLGITTEIHIFTRSVFSLRMGQGYTSATGVILPDSWVFPYEPNWTGFSPMIFSHCPHISGDLFHEVNELKINRIREIFSLGAVLFPWDGSDSIFIACVGAATILIESSKKKWYRGGLCSTSVCVGPMNYCGAGRKVLWWRSAQDFKKQNKAINDEMMAERELLN